MAAAWIMWYRTFCTYGAWHLDVWMDDVHASTHFMAHKAYVFWIFPFGTCTYLLPTRQAAYWVPDKSRSSRMFFFTESYHYVVFSTRFHGWTFPVAPEVTVLLYDAFLCGDETNTTENVMYAPIFWRKRKVPLPSIIWFSDKCILFNFVSRDTIKLCKTLLTVLEWDDIVPDKLNRMWYGSTTRLPAFVNNWWHC